MQKSEFTVALPGDGNDVVLHLRLDADRRVEHAWGEVDSKAETQHMMEWLCLWLAGQTMPFAYENVAEAFIKEFPHVPWTWSQLPQELVRQALYQTHPNVQTDVADVMVCRCHKVNESALKSALLANPTSNVQGLGLLTKAGTACGSCRPKLQALVDKMKPSTRRWNGMTNAEWKVKVQDSIKVWQERTLLPWAKEKQIHVSSFSNGKVVVSVIGGLTADQEWELMQVLEDYWVEDLPVELSLFLDFELA